MSSSITDTLRRLSGGQLVDEANEKLAALVQGVEATGKPGSITLKISLKKVGGGAMAANGKITASIPADVAPITLLFPTQEGALLTEDPKQKKLDLREVAAEPARELKTMKG